MELIRWIIADVRGRAEASPLHAREGGGEMELGKLGMNSSSTFSRKSSEVRS